MVTTIRLVVLGDGGVGKTAMTLQLTLYQFVGTSSLSCIPRCCSARSPLQPSRIHAHLPLFLFSEVSFAPLRALARRGDC